MNSPSHLLDTNICIGLLAGELPTAREKMEALVPGQIVTSAIVLSEVLIGLKKQGISSEGSSLFALAPVLPFDEAAARAYAGLPFRRGNFDRLIAAHALSLKVTLVTGNTRDFADVPGLRLEDWTQLL